MSTKRKPKYSLHKATGQARVRIDGKDFYLGEYGTPESQDRYDELVADWIRKQDGAHLSLTVDDLSLLFLDFADGWYRRKDGTPTGTVSNIRDALRYLVKKYGTIRVREFGPRKLKDVRQAMIEDGRCRTNINRLVHWIRRVFRWGVENEYVPVEIHTALTSVSSLQAGRTKARESDPVTGVDEGTVQDTLPHLPPAVAAMVQLQLLTGARPGEIVAIRPADITFGLDGVWTYRPVTHKTAHRGKERRIFIGPKAQEVLKPYLDRAPESHCFSPKESDTERNTERRKNRQTPMTPSQSRRGAKQRRRPPKDYYTKDSYGRAVRRGCELAFGMPEELRNIPKALKRIPAERREAEAERLKREATLWRKKHCWSPNQLRHSRATIIRERYGVEAAMVVLGHSDPGTTEIYAERDFDLAARIMREVG